MNHSIAIAVAYHKESIFISDEMFLPIQVGKAISNLDLGIQKDNTGDNISYLNPYYCELTAVYHLWKNCPDREFYGLCHYRRFLTFQKRSFCDELFHKCSIYVSKLVHLFNNNFRYTFIPYIPVQDQCLKNALDKFQNDILEDINNNGTDFYVAHKITLSTRTVYEHFSFICGFQRIDELGKILSENYPEYLPFFKETITSSSFHPANLAVFSKDLFSRYASFVFSVLEKHLQLNIGGMHEQGILCRLYLRQSGYLAEILTDIYIRKIISEGKKHKDLNILYVLSKEEIQSRTKLIQIAMKLRVFNINFMR